ncbi:MAG: hypothetical protein IJG16_07410, partial [Clostridia bacterium]|nr:hypothetical protein [Clostridia bacterium]
MIKATSAKGHTAGAPATCTEPQICTDCGAILELPTGHHYHTTVFEPTCTAMGYTVYECDDCDHSYIADYTDKIPHNYKSSVTAPTCTEMGFTTYTCEDCGDSYISDYTDKLPHEYKATVTEPACTELGFTTYVCDDCGDSYISGYIEAAGHKPSDWIIDTPATIENAGEKHIECTVCGEVLKTAAIPQLADKDNSDEDGNSKVGDYDILITDKDGKPVFNSEISIDLADNITIKLPADRLLTADDITTVTVTKNQQPVKNLFIFIADTNGNGATGNTDNNGQLSVPNAKSSTGDTNGTVTDNKNTYVVIATDKNGVLIPDCTVTAGENYSIDVKLPDNAAFDKDNRVTITVVNENGEPVKDLRVQVIGDGDFIENGYTNIKGQVTLPMSNTDITDDKGNAEVGEVKGDKIYDYIVTVSDENGLVKDALITLVADDNSVLVCLPDGKVIDYYNRTTIKVTKSDGTPVPDWKVTAYNKDGSGIRTELTDEDGIVIVPPLSEAPIAKPTSTPSTEATPLPGTIETPKPDNTAEPAATDTPTETAEPAETNTPAETAAPAETDKPDIIPTQPTPIPDIDGAVVENKDYKYRVYVWDKDGAITDFGLIKLNTDGSVNIELPDSKTLTADNKTYIRIVNEENGGSVKGVTVNVTDNAGNSASDKTNSNGIAVVPVSDGDFTDADGNASVTDADGKIFNVNVTDTSGNIENAYVKIADGKITVTLPDGKVLTTDNQTTVTVTDSENTPVSNMSVTVTDNKNNSATKPTDANGKITVPIKSSTGGGGSSS